MKIIDRRIIFEHKNSKIDVKIEEIFFQGVRRKLRSKMVVAWKPAGKENYSVDKSQYRTFKSSLGVANAMIKESNKPNLKFS